MVRELSRSRSVVSDAHIQALAKKLAHVLDSLVRTGKNGAVGTSTRADACVFTGDLQLSSCRHRFQTGETPGKLAHSLSRDS